MACYSNVQIVGQSSLSMMHWNIIIVLNAVGSLRGKKMDLIERQAAIDTLIETFEYIDPMAFIDVISKLQSIQSEIIRCKDCKWRCELRDDSAFYPYCEKLFNMGIYVSDDMMKDDDFCSLAERRENE